MTEWARWLMVGTGLALAIIGYVQFRRGKEPGRIGMIAAGVTELAVLAAAVPAIRDLVRGADLSEPATFIGYLFTTLAIIPAGVYFSRVEPSRWSSLVLTVGGLTVAVLAVRLGQLWVR